MSTAAGVVDAHVDGPEGWFTLPLDDELRQWFEPEAAAAFDASRCIDRQKVEAERTATEESEIVAVEVQWEQDWGLSLEAKQQQWRPEAHGTSARQQDHDLSPPSPPPTPPPRSQWSGDGANLRFDPASLSLSTHPAAFYSRLSATHSHLFLPPRPSRPSQYPVTSDSPSLVRCSALVLQAVPSSLFPLSPHTSEFVLCNTATDDPLLPSICRLLTHFAHIGTLLHSIERLADSLLADSSAGSGVAFGAALRSLCSHHKREVEGVLQRGGEKLGSACTAVQLHVSVQPLAQQVVWVHQLLRTAACSSNLEASSDITASLSSLPSILVGVDLLSCLHRTAQTMSPSSPFHAILTFLLSNAIIPFLRQLSWHVSRPPALQNLSGLLSATSSPALSLPSFLQLDLAIIQSAAEVLALVDRAGGSMWTVFGVGSAGEGSGLAVDRLLADDGEFRLSIGWSLRDAATAEREMRARGRAQQAHLATAVRRAEVQRSEGAQRLSSHRRAASQGARLRMEQQQAEAQATAAESSAARREMQEQYRAQLSSQVTDRQKREKEEKEKDKAEIEKAKAQELRRQVIIDEEKAALLTKIRAAEQGQSEEEVRRERWRTKRTEHAEKLAAVLAAEKRAQAEEMEEQPMNERPHSAQAATDSGAEANGEQRKTAAEDDNASDAAGPWQKGTTSGQLHDAVKGDSQSVSDGRRHESEELQSNRQRMTASNIFNVDSVSNPAPAEHNASLADTAATSSLEAASPAPATDAADALSALPGQNPDVEETPAAAVKQPTSPSASAASSPTTESNNQQFSAAHSASPTDSDTKSLAASSASPLSIDVAIRSTLVPRLRQQCAFVQRAALGFFVHELRVQQQFQTLQQFLLFRAGSTIDAFTSALFQSIHSREVDTPAPQHAPPKLSSQSLQLLWSDALRLRPPSADPSRILPTIDSTTQAAAASAFSRVEGLVGIDSVHLHYTAPPAVSFLLHPAALAGYARVFTLLLRLAYASSEMRSVYQWLRERDTQLRRAEMEHSKRTHTQTATRPTRRKAPVVTATDDSMLMSPSKRALSTRPHTPSSVHVIFHSLDCSAPLSSAFAHVHIQVYRLP